MQEQVLDYTQQPNPEGADQSTDSAKNSVFRVDKLVLDAIGAFAGAGAAVATYTELHNSKAWPVNHAESISFAVGMAAFHLISTTYRSLRRPHTGEKPVAPDTPN